MNSPLVPLLRLWLGLVLIIGCLGTGCETTSPGGSAPNVKGTLEPIRENSDVLRVGDKIVITLSDIPMGPLQNDQTIGEDGLIALHLGVSVKAAGKTLSQLQDDIRTQYVPRLYKRMSVSVRSQERFVYVGGEVRAPSRQQYTSDMTVLKAIKAAGDFTDFANKSRIDLIRSNGRIEKVDGVKAAKNPKLDLPILPGDQVYVYRRLF